MTHSEHEHSEYEKEQPINEADLGKLLLGNCSPMSLHVCLKPESGADEALSSLDPFEVVNFGVGRRYLLARLNIGKGFVEQFVLLNIYNPKTDIDAVAELAMLNTFKDDPQISTPSVIDFNNIGETYPPAFYCSIKRVFFTVPCAVCGKSLELNEANNLLQCPSCKQNQYSFYEAPDDANAILLETIFYESASAPVAETSIPCNGCENRQKCFPQAEKSKGVVVNEFHFIIPFSLDSFTVHGFSYGPLSLIDYCELVSGRPKADLLNTLLKSKETGRYRVLSESGNFSHRLEAQNYFIDSDPNLMDILSIKLRVFTRICNALRRLSKKSDISHIEHSSIRMDVSQSYSAGDSFTRARLVFLCSGKMAGGEKAKTVQNASPSFLADILFFIFFHNKKNNELAINIARDALIEKMNQERDVSLQRLSEIMDENTDFGAVFNCQSLRYSASSAPNIDSATNQVWLMVVRLGLVLTRRLEENVFPLNFTRISSVIEELRSIFSIIDLSRKNLALPKSNQDLLLAALSEIINDDAWVGNLLLGEEASHAINSTEINSNERNDQSSFVEEKNKIADDKTIIMSDKSELDKTVLFQPETEKTISSDDAETDDILIMSSINRILRQL